MHGASAFSGARPSLRVSRAGCSRGSQCSSSRRPTRPGEAVFSEGDPGKGLFIVLDGEIEVVRDTGQGPQRIVTFGPGTAFGELALIDDLPRSASALATTPTRLLILYRSHFEDLVAGDRVIALVVAKNLLRLLAGLRARRQRDARQGRDARARPPPATAALRRPAGERRPTVPRAVPAAGAAGPRLRRRHSRPRRRSPGSRSPRPSSVLASCCAVSSSRSRWPPSSPIS